MLWVSSGAHYNTDLTSMKKSIKLMIQEELSKLADEAEEDDDEDDEDDDDEDETPEPKPKRKAVKA